MHTAANISSSKCIGKPLDVFFLQALVYVMPPLFVVGFGVSWLVNRALSGKALRQLEAALHEDVCREHLRDAFKFKSIERVMLVVRVARAWDLDGVPLPHSTMFADYILKVKDYGEATFSLLACPYCSLLPVVSLCKT